MGKFNRFNRGGGNNRRSGGGGGGRGFGRSEMFDVVCSECGRDCQVPFKPTGDKPVYCNDCFGDKRSSRPERSSDRYGRNDRSSDRNFRRSERREKEMHDAICDNCGIDCQVPFRPTPGKPIYCSDCFDKVGGGDRKGDSRSQKGGNDLKMINDKLDKILKILEPVFESDIEESIMEMEMPKDTKKDKPEKKKEKKVAVKKEAKKASKPKKKPAKRKK